MIKKLNTIKDAGLTTVANIAHAAAQWLLLIIIVKQFDDLILGQLVLTLSIISPIFLLFSFKLRTLVVTDYHNERHFEQYLHARFFAQTIAIIFLVIISPWLLSNVYASIIISVIIFKVGDGSSELCYSYFHKQQKFKRAALSQTTRSFFTITMLLCASLFTQDIHITFFTWALTTIFFSLIDLFTVKNVIAEQEKRPIHLWATCKDMGALVKSLTIYKKYWPISVSILFSAMFVYIPNYTLEYFIGTESVGHFAAISYFLVAGGIIIHSLSQAVTPKLSHLYHQKKYSAFIRTTQILMLAGASIGLIGLCFAHFIGEWLLRLIYNDAIALLTDELKLIIIASMIRYSYNFLGSALNALKCFNQQALVYGTGSLTLLISCILLVPSLGTIGAAISMIIACAVEMFIMCITFYVQWKKLNLMKADK
jgi:O-antigen/teichoic acid export membrane protein